MDNQKSERRRADEHEAQDRCGVLLGRREFVIHSFVSAGALSALAAPTPAPTVAPTLPIAVDLRQFKSWDGGSGPSRDFWSQKLKLPWVNRGRGDWRDAQLTLQGSVPYASGTVSLGRIDLNVTALVNRWVASRANRGFYLRSTEDWAYTFAGRNNSTTSARPKLFVVTKAGTTIVLECSCNATWNPSTYEGRDSRNSFSVARDNDFAAVQFDTSALADSVQSATLSLTCLSLTNPGTLEIFELNPPVFRNGAGAMAVRTGLAHEFAFDRGLDAHASVVFAGDFSDLSKSRWQMGGVASGTTQVKDSRTGTTYLRGLIPQGQSWGCDLERIVMNGTSSGLPAKTETELYGRYYVYLEEDWGSELDANKMPGWDARMGWWNSAGYWQTISDSGERPTGLKVRNITDNRWEYDGASMRGHGGERLFDGNPYDDLIWVGNYMYHLDQADYFGENIKWPGVVLGRGRWYCIEQYIKMNSIAAPYDAIGNGVAVNDGVYRVWVDGVQAYERTNFRWRRHPEMGAQGFWLNWWHGGTAAALRNMHFRMDSMVIARAYIGPRNETL